MELKGVITSLNEEKALLTFSIEQGFDLHINELKDKALRLTLARWKEKRSLDANAYYWKLLSDLARVLSKEKRITTAFLHNMLLRGLGMLKTVDDKPVLALFPDTEEAETLTEEDEHKHYMPTSETTKVEVMPGVKETYRVYMELKGSHEMNTKEFSDLINALVSECKDQGIETLTPDEISHLEGLYEVNNAV